MYLFVIANSSISVSLYYLVEFGDSLNKNLAAHRPLLKFLMIKAVIFFAFWQGSALAVLERIVELPGGQDGKFATTLQVLHSAILGLSR